MYYFDNAATTYPKPEEVYKYTDKFYRDFGVFLPSFIKTYVTYGIDIVTITAIKNSVNKDMCILHDNARTSCPSFRPRFCRLQEFCRTW